MANPSGEIKYWKDGLPAEGGFIDANDAGTVKYWFGGLPSEWVIPSAGGPPAGIGIQLNIGDVWKDATGVQINIGDVWKTVTKMEINIGDVWKTIFEP